jgi:hypothetical protein
LEGSFQYSYSIIGQMLLRENRLNVECIEGIRIEQKNKMLYASTAIDITLVFLEEELGQGCQ